MEYTAIDGPMKDKKVDLSKKIYGFWRLESGVLTIHEYLINDDNQTLSYITTRVYEQNGTNIK